MSQALGKRPATLAATQPAAKQPRGGGGRGRGGGGRGAGRKPATRGLGFGLQQAQTSITELIGARRSEQAEQEMGEPMGEPMGERFSCRAGRVGASASARCRRRRRWLRRHHSAYVRARYPLHFGLIVVVALSIAQELDFEHATAVPRDSCSSLVDG